MVISGQCVFDYSGCHNKVQSTGRLTQKKCVYLLVVLEAGSLRSGQGPLSSLRLILVSSPAGRAPL